MKQSSQELKSYVTPVCHIYEVKVCSPIAGSISRVSTPDNGAGTEELIKETFEW